MKIQRYRAWIEAEKKMYMVRLIDMSPSGEVLSIRVADPIQIDEDGNVDWDFSEYTTGFVLEQCTGQKDQLGRDIFVGDIIEVTEPSYLHREGHISTDRGVLYDGGYSFYVRQFSPHASVFGSPEGEDWRSEEALIIGNRHENPEWVPECLREIS